MGLLLTFVSNFELILSYVLPFLFVLGIVVIVHELGHFLVGRLCGVGVQAFSFGMGPELFGYTDRQGTRWRVSAVPIGGYVKFAGDTNIASVRDATIPKVSPVSERSVTLNGQRLPKRAAIVAAGPIANFIFSILILSLLVYFYGVASAPPRIDIVSPDTPAQHAGFRRTGPQ